MSFLFGSKDKRTPYEIARDQTREISTTIRQEKRQLDRQINRRIQQHQNIELFELSFLIESDREIQRLSNDLRKHASTNNKDAIKTLAKAIVKVKHDKSHLYAAKANLDTIDNAIKSQLTNVRLTGVMQTSSDIARSLSELIKIEQFQSVSRQFNEEFIRMGIMNEMIDESVSAVLDNPELDDEADEEVDKVINEIIGNRVRQLPTVVASDQPVLHDDEDITARLQALKE